MVLIADATGRPGRAEDVKDGDDLVKANRRLVVLKRRDEAHGHLGELSQFLLAELDGPAPLLDLRPQCRIRPCHLLPSLIGTIVPIK